MYMDFHRSKFVTFTFQYFDAVGLATGRHLACIAFAQTIPRVFFWEAWHDME